MKITVIGAGSQEFGPATIRDVLLSDVLGSPDIELCLMDIDESSLPGHKKYAESVAEKLNRKTKITVSSNLTEAVSNADYVISAIEIKRYFFWAQDFHIPRKYGFQQIYGENGGPGGLFHALRNYNPTMEIVRAMEQYCPDALLLNYTNPLTKLTQLITTHSNIKTIGLCHGVFQGKKQLAQLLEIPVEKINAKASGLNHFSWFQSIHHSETGEDLYSLLKEKEMQANWLSDWDEIALSRTLYRIYKLYPSPGANHIGEYIRWAGELLASSRLQYFYDPKEKNPWSTGEIPPYLYNLNINPTHLKMYGDLEQAYYPNEEKDPNEICASGELAIPIIEGLSFNIKHNLGAINIRNNKHWVPGIDEHCVVEIPATVDSKGVHPVLMPKLPEGPLSYLRTLASINTLLVESYHKKSRDILLQALMLDPTTESYPNAVHLINEMFELQGEYLPEMKWDS